MTSSTSYITVESTTGAVGAPVDNESTGLSEGELVAVIVVPVVVGVIAMILIYLLSVRGYQL